MHDGSFSGLLIMSLSRSCALIEITSSLYILQLFVLKGNNLRRNAFTKLFLLNVHSDMNLHKKTEVFCMFSFFTAFLIFSNMPQTGPLFCLVSLASISPFESKFCIALNSKFHQSSFLSTEYCSMASRSINMC